MHLLGAEAANLALSVREATLEASTHVDVVLAPVALSITAVHQALGDGGHVKLAAQNMHHAEKGAFTGELAAPMVRDAGCAYVILGHSERRQHFFETDEGVNLKVKAALAHHIVPIVCVGESLEEREAEQTLERVSAQVRGALAGITAEQAATLVLAYEPIWAIGTGRTASPEQAQEVHAALRDLLSSLYDSATAAQVRIQYGGSVTPSNIAELIAQPDIDGALVGGASLKAESFGAIVQAASAK